MSKCFFYYALVSSLSFTVASVIFICKYKSYDGGIWAVAAAIMAGIVCRYYKLCIDKRLHIIFSLYALDYMAIFSYVICLISCGFGFWYLFEILYWKESLTKFEKSTIFPCVFSFLTGKWSFHLYKAIKISVHTQLETTFTPLIQDA